MLLLERAKYIGLNLWPEQMDQHQRLVEKTVPGAPPSLHFQNHDPGHSRSVAWTVNYGAQTRHALMVVACLMVACKDGIGCAAMGS